VPDILADLAGWAWRILLLVALAWLVMQALIRLELVTVPLAIALLLNALLSPFVMTMRARGVPRGMTTLLVVVPSLAVIALVMTWVVDQAVAQSPQLASQLSDTVGRLPVRSSTLVQWRDQLVQQILSHRDVLTQSAVTGLLTGARVLTGVLLTVLLTLIILTDGDRMWRWCVNHLPRGSQHVLADAGQHAFWRLSGWIRGTVLIGVFHAVVVAVTMLILGVPLVAPLAVLIFLGSFIPLVGALLFGGLAVLVTFASAGLTGSLVLLAVLLVDNQIEAHLLLPFLVGRYVRLHPFVVALAVPVGAVLDGLPGTLLAVPLTAAAYAALQRIELPVEAPRVRVVRRH
jgi:predicted PurR-regulated permease PerM